MDSTPLRLITCIVNHGLGEAVVNVAKKNGAQGGTILLGRGTAPDTWMQMLGLGDTRKEIAYIIVPENLVKPILDAICTDKSIAKKRGVAVITQVNQMIRHLQIYNSNSDLGESMQSKHEMISVIVNSGYADDIMAAARKAGAKGGTIINARGTGSEEDAKFFGLTIVPEKEMLIIITKSEETSTILDAIRQTPCLSQPGMGIAFCSPVIDFVPIGGNK